MPPKPSWLRRIPEIRANIEDSTVPFLDRAALQELFRLGRRQAGYLLKTLGPAEYQIGRALLVRRHTILAFLEAASKGQEYRAEEFRRRRLREALEEAQGEIQARAVRFKVPSPTAELTVAGLPDTIRLAGGELRITCKDAQDLLQQLYLLSRMIAKDYAAFEAAAGAAPSRAK